MKALQKCEVFYFNGLFLLMNDPMIDPKRNKINNRLIIPNIV